MTDYLKNVAQQKELADRKLTSDDIENLKALDSVMEESEDRYFGKELLTRNQK